MLFFYRQPSGRRLSSGCCPSLDPPSRAELDKLWADEAEDRIDAFERGEIEAIPAERVFESLGGKTK
jgi:hypothetical protein